MIKGLGIDSVEISRIAGVYQRYGEHFLRKILSPGEISNLLKRRELIPHLAGRFAAKEACLKALGTGWSAGIRWRDIEILNDRPGKPQMHLHGQAKKLFRALKADTIHCSISHMRDSAQAIVVIE